MQLTPACDRCHFIKARCLAGTAQPCNHCYRLGHSCTYTCPRGKRGRKPRVLSPRYLASDASEREDSHSNLVPETTTILVHKDTADEEDTFAMQKLPLVSTLYRDGVISQISEYTSVKICKFFSFRPLSSEEMCRMIRSWP